MSTSHLIHTTTPSIGGRVAVITGFLLHAGVGVFVLSSGLMMPVWAVVVLAAVWVASLAGAIRERHRPLHVLLTPVVTVHDACAVSANTEMP